MGNNSCFDVSSSKLRVSYGRTTVSDDKSTFILSWVNPGKYALKIVQMNVGLEYTEPEFVSQQISVSKFVLPQAHPL